LGREAIPAFILRSIYRGNAGKPRFKSIFGRTANMQVTTAGEGICWRGDDGLASERIRASFADQVQGEESRQELTPAGFESVVGTACFSLLFAPFAFV
jgi:hypothetical protein